MFKPNLKHFACAYLYSDGHCVLKLRRTDAKSGQILEWVDIFQTTIKCRFEGRIIFDNAGVFKLALSMPCVEILKNNGSDKTKELGIKVVSLLLRRTGDFINYIPFVSMPGFYSGVFTHQPEVSETFESVKNNYSWDAFRATIHLDNKESI
jgi:hypothetical protein